MSLDELQERAPRIVEDYEFDEPPEALWRAVSLPAIRERWLPANALASHEPISQVPGREASYRMREDAPPFLESIVTFRLDPSGAGGTRLRIIHELNDARLREPGLAPANGNARPPLMRAA
ncbi:SRPBCC family protein [Aureimonas psammosilenae]|uniref:SRPBCC family protein n=1 Tax=Aureimonas psammosilenae TaxID=2495496 RepID=UPI001261034D|nr:SRPBCC domain-containing protein [Aureimonas psammosilenae]